MSKKEITHLFILGIIFAIALALIRIFELIDTAQTIQLILTFVLVLVTVAYVKRTAEIASTTREQTKASVKMAEEMREQRYDTVRPVIDIQRQESNLIEEALVSDRGNTSHGLLCKLHNIGLGPAIDVCSLVQPPWAPWGQSQRHDFGTLAIGGETTMNLSLEQEDNRTALVVCYKDLYGRVFESSREVQAGKTSQGWIIGPLKTRLMGEDKK